MSQVNQSLPAVLRRQSKKLHADAGDREAVDRACASMRRAADELEVRQRAAGPLEDELAAMVHEQRRLRDTLRSAFMAIAQLVPQHRSTEILDEIRGTLRAIPPRGQGRRIIGITVGDDSTREFVLEEAADAINAYFDGREADEQEEVINEGLDAAEANAVGAAGHAVPE